jgi:hypothetical protein
MTHERDIERILGHWLADGPTEVPDRVMDVIADRIARQPQRPAWRLDWRDPNMHTSLRAAAVLAAVVILAIGAVYLRGPDSGSNIGSQTATPSPIPTVAATPAPSLRSLSPLAFRPVAHLEMPDGWVIPGDVLRNFTLAPPAGSSEAGGSIGVMTAPFVSFADGDCEGQAPAGVGTSIAEVVAALAGDPRLAATPPQAVTIGDRTGQMLDVQIASDWTGTCGWSEGMPAVLLLSATDTGPASGLRGTERARLIFLDVEDAVVSINVGTSDGSKFDAFVAQAMPIVESMRFTP